jgi:hypothetical protein
MEDREKAFLAPETPLELQAKLRAIGQPYIDRMNADPLNAEAIHAELSEKVAGIVWEYTLRMDAKNSK